MKAVIFGASGILGQHMRLCIPPGVEAIFVRRHADALHLGLDLCDREARESFLDRERPDVIVNLAGVSNTDAVERDPDRYYEVNAKIPGYLADWCTRCGSHLIQVSSQAVFRGGGDGGEALPPYDPYSLKDPVNCYGAQKCVAEKEAFLRKNHKSRTIVRPTFVLGVRPLPHVGRQNPMEQMLAGGPQRQVNDRWFSVSFARDVAAALWKAAIERPGGIIHVGLPDRVSRYDIASKVARDVEPVSHDSFPGLAPRPIDTTYAGTVVPGELESGLARCGMDYMERKFMSMQERARELALFFGTREDECAARLGEGWEAIHNAVSEDWNRTNPQTDEEILEWYRQTEAYIWELSFYHADPGWNYTGMCSGIAERLKAADVKRVLCLGDGIGDLTISLIRAGFDAHYHDLAGSRTADFAQFRSWMHLGKYMPAAMSEGWAPEIPEDEWDAIVSLDFLEHVPNVEEYVSAIKAGLKPGGLFCAQNAFAIGSGPAGSMPMHLARNDRFERDWDPTLFGLGFVQESSNWYRAPADEAFMVAAPSKSEAEWPVLGWK